MKLEGIHHVTCITADAPGNVDFYVRVLGLRLVKKTVNQDDPTVYHLFYADELGSAGADITFFEYPGVSPGRAGDGMVHRVVFRVGGEAALARSDLRCPSGSADGACGMGPAGTSLPRRSGGWLAFTACPLGILRFRRCLRGFTAPDHPVRSGRVVSTR